MGYFCPDCGHEDGKPYQPEKPFHGFVGEWVDCSEEMPDDEITVLVWLGDDATLAFHDTEIRDRRGDSGWIVAGGSRVLIGVTHWCREICQPNSQAAHAESVVRAEGSDDLS